jgi:mono/diheme cytochrome c family protein
MRWRALLLLTVPAIVAAQDRGLEVFNKSCATGYCHGVRGTDGGAPRLAARGFDEAYIAQTIRTGIPGTAMPAFGTDLPRTDLLAVVAYVDSLNGVTPSVNPALASGPAPRKLAPEAQRGRDLFADQVRGLTRCSNCHQVDGLGISVTLPLGAAPENVAALRQIASPKVETAMAEGDTFPALVLNKSGAQTKLYDLTAVPPVLRTFPKGVVSFKEGSGWRHAAMLTPYSDRELADIVAFLKAVVKP